MPVLGSFVHQQKVDPRLLTWDKAVGYDSLKNNGLDPTAPIGGSAFGVGSGFGGASGTGGVGANGIEQLTSMVNQINQRAQQAANSGRIPDEPALETQSSSNIGSALRGEVPNDVINLLGQQAAERGVSTGSPMGASNNAAYLKALGLTSLGRMDTGQDLLSKATARNPAAPIYDAGNQVLTAAQVEQAIQARLDRENRLRIAEITGGRRGAGNISSSTGGATHAPASIGSTASTNWADVLFPKPNPSATGWSFPPGLSNVPVTGDPGNRTDPFRNNGMSDQEFYNYWFPEDPLSPTPTQGQYDYNLNDAFEGYA